jgi:hypothetical protein
MKICSMFLYLITVWMSFKKEKESYYTDVTDTSNLLWIHMLKEWIHFPPKMKSTHVLAALGGLPQAQLLTTCKPCRGWI